MTAGRIFLSGWILIFCAAALAAENGSYPTIRAVVNPETAAIGVPLEYKISIAGSDLKGIVIRLPEEKVYFPEKDTASAGVVKAPGADKESDTAAKVPLYIIQNAKKEDESKRGTEYLSITVRLAYFRPGKHTLPEIVLYDAQNVRIGYRVPVVDIKSVNPNGEFHEIEPPLELSGNYYRLLFILLAIIALSAGGYFLWRWFEKKRKAEAPVAVAIPPIETFMSEVGALVRKRYIDEGKIEEHVTELSLIFRRCVSSLFGFDAVEMTGSEVLAAMERVISPLRFNEYRGDVARALDLWDLAKFAEFAPDANALRSNLDDTIRLARKLSGVKGNVGN